MKFFNLYLLTILFSKVSPSFIQPPTKKICKDCKHFIADNIECKKFGEMDSITGIITYESARRVRKDEKKCGKNAIEFEENHLKIITEPYYYLRKNCIVFLFSLFFMEYFVFYIAEKKI